MTVLLIAALLMLLWVLAPPSRHAPGPQVSGAGRRHRAGPLEVARAVEQLATVLASGSTIRQAWAAVGRSAPPGDLADLARAGAAGADPRRPGAGRLHATAMVRSLGTALAVCERTGAPTAVMLEHLAEALRDLHDAALARRSAFAGPRSTARILLVLPLGGLALGALLGGDPLHLLLSTPGGHLLGAVGLALTVAGWWWMHRMLRAADPPAPVGLDGSVLLELVAGALEAGLPLASAAQAVAQALPTSADREALERFASGLHSGLGAERAARALPTQLAALGRSAVLAEGTGADLSRVLRSAARDGRRGRARDAEVRAAQLAVRLVLPTGLTLLPAFVALGIIPTVISLLGGTLSPGAAVP
ncbi:MULTISPECIES: type II secretion system F family protein [unclassified Brachybacterium]|uniref:type II secretion system F family protein n=1 Tax=unclassified Brachybacterium TaxID=2623841 RepID=UPI000C808826|nr:MULTISPECIES: type II secretion system F family protein [unclassified Brachybacterium]PMC76849.1 pilus assembly protein TadB [Brachybacterium sp. UMB0905]